MTISANSTRTVVTLPAGATTTTFTFDYLDVENIKVAFNNVPKFLGADYTITNKTITFTIPLTAQTVVSIISNEPYGRSYDFLNPEQFNAKSVNYQLDSLALELIQIRDKAILVGEYDPSIDLSSLIRLINEAVVATKASEDNAKASEQLANDWAEKTTDVIPGHKSAKTWAEAASQIVIPNGSVTGEKLSTPFTKESRSTVNNSYATFSHTQLNTNDALNGLMVTESSTINGNSQQGYYQRWSAEGSNIYPASTLYFRSHTNLGGKIKYFRENGKDVISTALYNDFDNGEINTGLDIAQGRRPYIPLLYSDIVNLERGNNGVVVGGDIVKKTASDGATLFAVRVVDGYVCTLTSHMVINFEDMVWVKFTDYSHLAELGLVGVSNGKGVASAIETTGNLNYYMLKCFTVGGEITIRAQRAVNLPPENLTVGFSITFTAADINT